jgi:hypothetical protein
MFINDVGEVTWEEINDGIAGSNYGWNLSEGPTTNPLFRSPLFAYLHGGTATTGCATRGWRFLHPATVQFRRVLSGSISSPILCTGWIRVFDRQRERRRILHRIFQIRLI